MLMLVQCRNRLVIWPKQLQGRPWEIEDEKVGGGEAAFVNLEHWCVIIFSGGYSCIIFVIATHGIAINQVGLHLRTDCSASS